MLIHAFAYQFHLLLALAGETTALASHPVKSLLGDEALLGRMQDELITQLFVPPQVSAIKK